MTKEAQDILDELVKIKHGNADDIIYVALLNYLNYVRSRG